jgi:hypothetical protein
MVLRDANSGGTFVKPQRLRIRSDSLTRPLGIALRISPAQFPRMKGTCRFFLTIILLVAVLFPLMAGGEDPVVIVNFPKTQVFEVLDFYRHLTGRPVLVDLELNGVITTVMSPQEFTHDEAIRFIRKTLLESYGIEIRDSERGEALATWSPDPKYPLRSDSPIPKRRKITILPTPADK